jgi:hypothetical protein
MKMYSFSDAILDFSIFSIALFVYMSSIIRIHLFNIINKSHRFRWTRRAHFFNIYGGAMLHLATMFIITATFDGMVPMVFLCLCLFISFNTGFLCIKNGNVNQHNYFPIFCGMIIVGILTMNIVTIHFFCEYKSEHPAFDKFKYLVIFGSSFGSVVSLSNFLYFLVYLKTIQNQVEIVQLEMVVVQEENENLNEDCPICLEQLKLKKCIKTECEHLFHEECLKISMQTAMKCPMCRRDFKIQPCL